MKKFFAVLSVTLLLVACKNPGDSKVKTEKDTIDVVVKDTVTVVKDTVITVDTLR